MTDQSIIHVFSALHNWGPDVAMQVPNRIQRWSTQSSKVGTILANQRLNWLT